MPQKITKKTKKTKKIKRKVEKKVVKKPKAVPKPKKVHYFEAVGRRKTAVARVRISESGSKSFLINGKELQRYFSTLDWQQKVLSPLEKTNCLDKFEVSVKVRGGGLNAQSEAVRHGLARALVLFNPNFRKKLKKAGFLTRDSRMRERKKFGLKRARRAPQWQKR